MSHVFWKTAGETERFAPVAMAISEGPGGGAATVSRGPICSAVPAKIPR